MLDSSWNVMARGDARQRKWSGNWRMEWVASTLHTTSEYGVSSITTADTHIRLPVVDWTDAPADLNGFVRCAERRNLVSARVPSHFNWPLLAYNIMDLKSFLTYKYLTLNSYHLDTIYLNKDVRIRGYFWNPKGVREQKSLGNTGLQHLSCMSFITYCIKVYNVDHLCHESLQDFLLVSEKSAEFVMYLIKYLYVYFEPLSTRLYTEIARHWLFAAFTFTIKLCLLFHVLLRNCVSWNLL